MQLFEHVDVHSKQVLKVTVWCFGLQGILKHQKIKKAQIANSAALPVAIKRAETASSER